MIIDDNRGFDRIVFSIAEQGLVNNWEQHWKTENSLKNYKSKKLKNQRIKGKRNQKGTRG